MIRSGNRAVLPLAWSRQIRSTPGMRFRSAVVFALFCAVACLPVHSEAPPTSDAARLVGILELEPGDTVGEIGSGDGDLTLEVAQLLGPQSRVYTTELADELPALRKTVESAVNVTVIEAGLDETNLPDACCDAVYMRRVFHHFQRPERNAASLFRTVRPGGRVAVLDFEPKSHWDQPEGTPERGGHGMPSDTLVEQMTAAGFELVRVDRDWREDLYAAIFRRPDPR